MAQIRAGGGGQGLVPRCSPLRRGMGSGIFILGGGEGGGRLGFFLTLNFFSFVSALVPA